MQPLAGLTVAVTRPARRAESLRAPFQREGARVVVRPTVRFAPPTDVRVLLRAAAEAPSYDWVVFTSATGVEVLTAAAAAHPDGGECLPSDLRACAVGPATAAALKARGLNAALVPDRFVAESLLEALEAHGGLTGRRILLARAAGARDLLPRRLRERGARVEDLPAYRTLPDEDGARDLVRWVAEGKVDVLTFTSGSTARSFYTAWVSGQEGREGDDLPETVRVAAIGPITAAVIRGLGMRVDVLPDRYTGDGLVEACVASLGSG